MSFSHEAVQDAKTSWIRQALSECVPPTDFIFHFGQVPEDLQVCREILAEIGLPDLIPHARLGTIAVSA